MPKRGRFRSGANSFNYPSGFGGGDALFLFSRPRGTQWQDVNFKHCSKGFFAIENNDNSNRGDLKTCSERLVLKTMNVNFKEATF